MGLKRKKTPDTEPEPDFTDLYKKRGPCSYPRLKIATALESSSVPKHLLYGNQSPCAYSDFLKVARITRVSLGNSVSRRGFEI